MRKMKINYYSVRNFIVANIVTFMFANVSLDYLNDTLDKYLGSIELFWIVALILLKALKGNYEDHKQYFKN